MENEKIAEEAENIEFIEGEEEEYASCGFEDEDNPSAQRCEWAEGWNDGDGDRGINYCSKYDTQYIFINGGEEWRCPLHR